MATRSAARQAARAQSTRSGRVPQSLIDAELTQPLGQRDVRNRAPFAPDARLREAKRRLGDPETAAGRPGTNLCRFTGEAKAATQAGKRPSFYTKKNVGRGGVSLCKDVVDEAWSDPEFIAEQKRVCGEEKEYVFPYTRKDGRRVRGHCRNLHAPRPRARKAKSAVDPRQKQLDALIRKRDAAGDMVMYQRLNAEIRELRAAMAPASPAPRSAPASKPSAPRRIQTGRTPRVFNAAIEDYLESLPRGERQRAANTMRLYITGPAQLPAGEALARYKERRVRDARAPVGGTEYDDSGEEDQELGGFGVTGLVDLHGRGVSMDTREFADPCCA